MQTASSLFGMKCIAVPMPRHGRYVALTLMHDARRPACLSLRPCYYREAPPLLYGVMMVKEGVVSVQLCP